jgi:hypothetical protein
LARQPAANHGWLVKGMNRPRCGPAFRDQEGSPVGRHWLTINYTRPVAGTAPDDNCAILTAVSAPPKGTYQGDGEH